MTKKAIRSAVLVASDFVVIIGPWFDADVYLERLGLKFFWSDWTGHTWHFHTKDLRQILNTLGLRNYVIMACGEVKDSSDPAIHPLDSPRDQHEYNPEIHPPKPLLPFSQAVYKEMTCYVQLRPLENWGEIVKARQGAVIIEKTPDYTSQAKGQQEQEQLLSTMVNFQKKHLYRNAKTELDDCLKYESGITKCYSTSHTTSKSASRLSKS
ncbi:MAG: hypothetical protein IMF11_13675 [Proteobacteria bacterium]|nr:hypothetical protein [Pseudomonadota bacterium]